MTQAGNINLNLPKGFFAKPFAVGALCVLLGAAFSACPSTPKENTSPVEGFYTVIFDKNGGDNEASPQSKTVVPPATTLDALPETPTWEGHRFVEWNTAADGSGSLFTENTPVSGNLTVYAQWGPPSAEGLNIAISPSTATLTPIIDGAYGERSTTLRVVVSGFDNADDASKAGLSIGLISGLTFVEIESSPEGNTQTFHVTVEYNGQAAFPEGYATLHVDLTNIEGYTAQSKTTRMNIRDGLAAANHRAIPLRQANMEAFNRYANTPEGLTRHYRLTEKIELVEPAQPTASNWTAIGTTTTPFVGSFNGNGYEFLRLRIRASGNNYQGLFGYIGEGATLENLRLTDVSVRGRNHVGSLVGYNYKGTVQSSYATGSVSSSEENIGGLVGYNNQGTVQNCYATGSVSGSNWVGGLVGWNYFGTVDNSHATGSVSGDSRLGGLAGENYQGTVDNSYATGNVSSSSNSYYVGGLVGYNEQGPVQNSYATGSVSGSSWVGGLVGYNEQGTVQNSYATGSVTSTNENVGGLLGINHGGTVQNCYATGDINGQIDVGGLVGDNSYGLVQNCYATGSINGHLDVGGLVGNNNYGTLQNSLALNPRVSGTNNVGRVAHGYNSTGTLISNHAFIGMRNSAGSSISWNNIGPNNPDGANSSAEILRRREGFPAAFLSSPWVYLSDRLPGLLGQTVDMPLHIQ
ncbi:MAG: InlB B-repeat-containing protein [Cystobacterineae bacterium]|nr:InlB B-repeat-containing protein [Cystobacterineae bacterium]